MLVHACRLYQSCFRSLTTSHPQAHWQALNKTDSEQVSRLAFESAYARGQRLRASLYAPFLDDFQPKTVLDYGCSGGGTSLALSEFFDEVWGVDIDRERIAFGQREIQRRDRADRVHLMEYDGYRLPFEDDSFDMICTSDVLEHVHRPELALSEFYRILRPGGRVFLFFVPWRHAHGKHMWGTLPGWWSHLIFPERVVMETAGHPPGTRYEDLGLFRLTVSRFTALLAEVPFTTRHIEYRIKASLSPLLHVPVVRELFISGVHCVLEKRAPS